MKKIDCCLRSRLVVDIDQWLVPVGSLINLHSRRLQLFRCPSCDALWYREATLVGHQDYVFELFRINSEAEFNELIIRLQSAEAAEIELLKKKYEAHGLDWRTGRKLPS